MSYCANCGYELKEGAKFCVKCGNKIESSNVNVTNIEKKIHPSIPMKEMTQFNNITRIKRLNLQKMFADFIMIKAIRYTQSYEYDERWESYSEAEKTAASWTESNISTDISLRRDKAEKIVYETLVKQNRYRKNYNLGDDIDIAQLREKNNNQNNERTVLDSVNEQGVLIVNSRSVGSNAYKGNDKIKTIIIESNCESIGDYAFAECPNLERVVFRNQKIDIIPKGLFYGCDKLSDVTLSEYISAIDEMAFMNCTSIINLWIPFGIGAIAAKAFMGCNKMRNIVIPDTVLAIGDMAFAGCTSLGQIDLPYFLKELGDDAFKEVACVWIDERETEFPRVSDFSNTGAKEIKYLEDYMQEGIYNPKDVDANKVIRNAKIRVNAGELWTKNLLKVEYKKTGETKKENPLITYLFSEVQESFDPSNDVEPGLNWFTNVSIDIVNANKNPEEKYKTKMMKSLDYLWYFASDGEKNVGRGAAILCGPLAPAMVFGTNSSLLCVLTMLAYVGIFCYGIKEGKRMHKEKYPERYNKDGELFF